MADSIKLLSSFCYLLCFCLLFFSFFSYKSCVYGARELATHHHANKKKSQMPVPSTCSGSTTGLHRYGPCSPLGQENPPPTSREVLLKDQSRVRSLYSKTSNDFSNDESGIGAELPVQEDSSGNFVVKVGFGTPKRDLTLMFDTGSYMTWIQCQPCTACYNQAELPIFDPSQSSTFSKYSCGSSTCPPYSVLYHDKSYSSGYYAQDKLTLSSNNVVNDFVFVFGCGLNNSEGFGNVAGILGVGQGDASIMSQTTNDFGQQFCYCLPRSENSTGYLRFGFPAYKTCTPPEISIRLSTRSNNYYVNLVGITIGQTRLDMSSNVVSGSSPSTIIDSGTFISRLPGSVYSQLKSSFQDLMSKFPAAEPLSDLLDTCYDLSDGDDIDDIVPSMILHFDESKDLKLDPSAVALKDSKSGKVCLAFGENENSDDLTIIGNHQQRNLKISYSILDKQVGFSTGGCGD